jgi:hypothetical protein
LALSVLSCPDLSSFHTDFVNWEISFCLAIGLEQDNKTVKQQIIRLEKLIDFNKLDFTTEKFIKKLEVQN